MAAGLRKSVKLRKAKRKAICFCPISSPRCARLRIFHCGQSGKAAIRLHAADSFEDHDKILEDFMIAATVLQGHYIRLEPLDRGHIEALASASAGDWDLYRWSPVPRGIEETTRYVESALATRDAGQAMPFATVRLDDDKVIGSTRLYNFEFWEWPTGHALHGRTTPDACEIGYTWLAHSAIRTAANTETKLLMLTHAFEVWRVLRVCLHTDARNDRSRAAIERIGGKFEGILRSHRMAADYIARDSARFSFIASEWPEAKKRLQSLRDRV
jgi:N-acetyltransferase